MDSPRAFGNTVCFCLRLTICSRTCHLGWVKTLGVKPASQRHAGQRQRRTAIILTTKWLFLAAAVVAGALEFFFPARALAVPATLLDDSYTTSAKPFSTPAGSQPTIVISPKTTGFVQFDLSTLPAGTQAGDVAKASLTLYVSAGSVKSPGSFSVKVVTGAWDELTLNQANAPALEAAAQRLAPFAGRFEIWRGNFSDLRDRIEAGSCDGVLLDLGVSSAQLDQPERGFSFQI